MNITVMVEISISYVNNLEKWENGYNQTFVIRYIANGKCSLIRAAFIDRHYTECFMWFSSWNLTTALCAGLCHNPSLKKSTPMLSLEILFKAVIRRKLCGGHVVLFQNPLCSMHYLTCFDQLKWFSDHSIHLIF